MVGPEVLRNHFQDADIAATMLVRGLISPEFYKLIVSDDPIRSIARKTHRMGTVAMADHVYKSGNIEPIIGAASIVLGVEESGRVVLKREMGIPDESLDALLSAPDFAQGPGPEALTAPPTMDDGVSLHPDHLARHPQRMSPPAPRHVAPAPDPAVAPNSGRIRWRR
jgi:hypothetical protein